MAVPAIVDPLAAYNTLFGLVASPEQMAAFAQRKTLLDYALNEGGLGAARAEYTDMMVADASTTTFTIKAGGLDKTVSVYALGMEAGYEFDTATIRFTYSSPTTQACFNPSFTSSLPTS